MEAVWIAVLEIEGFAVTIERSFGALLMRNKLDNGIPKKMSCRHTARVEGFMIEGQVPVADIRCLLTERPDAVGLAVPGMRRFWPIGRILRMAWERRRIADVVRIRCNVDPKEESS